MTDPDRPVTDADLQGWVDDQLTTARRRTVEVWLAARPAEARLAREWREDRERLRACFDAMQEPALPLRLMPRSRPRRSVSPLQLAASVVVALGLGGVAGWHVHRPPIGVAAVAQESLTADSAFARVADFSPSADISHVGTWASHVLGRTVTPPDLTGAGYRLTGGHVVATMYGPGCVFVYAASTGSTLSVFVRPMHGVDWNARMRAMHGGAVGARGYVWADDGLGVGLVGTRDQTDMLRLAADVRRELRESGPLND